MTSPRPLNQYEAIRDQYDYHSLVASGMAWELFPSLESTWEQFRAAKASYLESQQPQPTKEAPNGATS